MVPSITAVFQSLVWWIRGFKIIEIIASVEQNKFQSLVWWIRGFKLRYDADFINEDFVSILGLVDKGF